MALLLGKTACVVQAQPGEEPVEGPSYASRHWTVADGLPVNTIRDLAQGPRGYLWMTTYDGLVRFDGVRFTALRTTNSALPTNRLHRLWLGPEEDLWVQTGGGQLARVDPRRGQVEALYGAGAGGVPGRIEAMAVDASGTRWLGTRRMLYRRPQGASTWTPVLPVSAHVMVLEADSTSGTVWAGTAEQGLWRAQGQAAERAAIPRGKSAGPIHALAVGKRGVYVGTEKGGMFVLRNRQLRPLRIEGEAPALSDFSLKIGAGGSLWLGTDRDIFTLRETEVGYRLRREGPWQPPTPYAGTPVWMGPGGHRWTTFGWQVRRDGRTVLRTGGAINRLFVDREGNRWVATHRDGLYRLRRTPITAMGTAHGLPTLNVYGTTVARADSSTFWLTGLGGPPARLATGAPGSPTVQAFPERWGLETVVWTILEDRGGTHWIGTDEGLFRRDGAAQDPSDRARRGRIPPALRRGDVRAAHEDRGGRLRVLHDGALYTHSPDDGSWRRDTTGVPSGASGRAITQMHDGSVWIGTAGSGILRVSPGGERTEHLSVSGGLGSNRIRAIYEDETGIVWVGTEDAGLTRVERRGDASFEDDVFTTITPRDGLPDDVIHQILPGTPGQLWMSTNRGLFRIQRAQLDAYARGAPVRLQPVRYAEADGMASREANGGVQSAGARTADGRLWFPTQGGVVRVEPRAVRDSPPPPAVVEAVATPDSVYAASDATLQLRAEDRGFTVRYAGLHFARPEATRFRVSLDGVDAGPTQTVQRTLRYANVPPGRHTFRVQAAGPEGTFGPPAHLTLVIPPHWWETTWFYVFCALGLLGIGLLMLRQRDRRQRRRRAALERTVNERTGEVQRQKTLLETQAERLRELDEAKNRFFANITHEFRTPLALILGPIRELRTRTRSETGGEWLDVIEDNGQRLLRLVDQVLGLARLDAGHYRLEARPADLGAEARRVTRSFVPLAERKRLSLVFEGPGEEGTADAQAPVYLDRVAFEHILSNLLSNAIKFTPPGGRVAVAVEPAEDEMRLVVSDDGPGIPEHAQAAVFDRFRQADDSATRAQEGTGIGLSFAHDLVVLHGGTLTLDSTEGAGAAFTVHFPRGRAHLTEEQVAGDQILVPEPELPDAPAAEPGVPALETPAEASLAAGDDPPEAPKENARIVLVVDDNAVLRRYVRSVLVPDYGVVEAGDGEAGLRAAREHLPDVILADVMMPGTDGLTMTRRLKSDAATEAIPVILLTARAGVRDEVEGLSAGADDYVTKPFDADVLRQRVGGVVALQERLRRRLREQLRHEALDAERPDGERDSGDEGPAPPEVERRARRLIRTHLTDSTFDVAALARELGTSRSGLYRTFKKGGVEETPAALITRVRIEEAQALLAGGEETVTQVAYAVGFEQLSSFSRAFRAQVGCSPSEVA